MSILYLPAAILAAHLLVNTVRWVLARNYFRKFKSGNQEIAQDIPQIANLFAKAGTDEWTIEEYVAGSERIAAKSKLSDCIGKASHADRIYYVFQKTIGVYKYRMCQTINPLYWLNMPVKWMKSLNKPPMPFVQNLLAALLWLIGVVISYLIGKFLDLALSGDFLSTLESMIK